MRDNRWIWLINGPDRVGISLLEKTSSGSDAGHCRTEIVDDRIADHRGGFTSMPGTLPISDCDRSIGKTKR